MTDPTTQRAERFQDDPAYRAHRARYQALMAEEARSFLRDPGRARLEREMDAVVEAMRTIVKTYRS